MEQIRISVIENSLPEAGMIGRELRRMGCEVTVQSSQPKEIAGLSRGCAAVIFSAEALSPADTESILRELVGMQTVAVIAEAGAFAEPSAAEGNAVFFRRPFALSAVLYAVTGSFGIVYEPEEDMRDKVMSVLTAMGFPVRKAGFGALRDAVLLTLEDDDPGAEGCHLAEAGSLNDQTAGAADKAVSRIVGAVWGKTSGSLKALVFGSEAAEKEKAPSAKETVIALARFVRSGSADQLLKSIAACNDTSCK